MFELKEAIENWKQKLSCSNSFTTNDIEELESHLLDEIDALKEKDLSEEEAFFVATSRLGSVDLLSSEFIKVNNKTMFFNKIVLLLGGYVVISFIQNLISIISMLITQTLVISNMDPAIGNVIDSSFNSNLSFGISFIFSVIFLFILLNGRLQLLTKIQSRLKNRSNTKKIFLFVLCVVMAFINSMGFYIVMNLITYDNMDTLGVVSGQSNFSLVWTIIICLSFMLLSFRQYKKEQLV